MSTVSAGSESLFAKRRQTPGNACHLNLETRLEEYVAKTGLAGSQDRQL